MKYFIDKVIKKLRRLILGPTENLILNRIKDLAIKDFLGKRENQIHTYIDQSFKLIETNTVVKKDFGPSSETALGNLFTKHGSDKDSRHSYSWIYSELLGKMDSPRILEIGIGTNNSFAYGGLPPGGSLKAWREAYPKAHLVGADIDPQAIAELDELGYVVDQLSYDSLQNLVSDLNKSEKFDLIIDDGFHEPHANIMTYLHLYECLKDGGVYVIEDVHESLIDFWRIIGIHLPGSLEILDLRIQRPSCEDNTLLLFCKEY